MCVGTLALKVYRGYMAALIFASLYVFLRFSLWLLLMNLQIFSLYKWCAFRSIGGKCDGVWRILLAIATRI